MKPIKEITKTSALLSQHQIIINTALQLFHPFDSLINPRQEIREAFAIVIGTAYPHENTVTLIDECERIQKQHLIRGIVPELIEYFLEACFEYLLSSPDITPSTKLHINNKLKYKTALQSTYLSIKHIQNQSRERVWKARNDITIEWEKQHKITITMKRKSSQNPNPIHPAPFIGPSKRSLKRKANSTILEQYHGNQRSNSFINPAMKPKWKCPPKEPTTFLLPYHQIGINRPLPEPPP
jgi:hypothetical protein